MADESPAPNAAARPETARVRARRLMLLAVWVGASVGLLEVAVLAFQKLIRHGLTHRGIQVVWMAPLAETLLLMTIGVFLLAVGWRWRQATTIPFALATYVFVGSLSLLVLPGWFAWWAVVLLAAGVAIQTGRLTRRFPDRIERVARRSVLIPIVISIVLAAAANTGMLLTERRAIARLPLARSQAPNVILVIWDTVRAQSLSLYGYLRRTTPNLERLAERGVVFERAYATAPWTLPSHASMFTGLFSHQLDVAWAVPFHQPARVLPDVLGSYGYRTGGFVANLLYTDREHGLARGFLHYEDRRFSLGEILSNSALLRELADPEHPIARLTGPHRYLWRKRAATLNRDFLKWAVQDSTRPFFAFLNYFDAHDPYLPPGSFHHHFGHIHRPGLGARIRKIWRGEGIWDLSAAEAAEEQRAYDAAIAYLDHSLAELVAALEAKNLLRNTIIIVTSDHGEEFGEHEKFKHGETLFLPALHVPLVVIAPGRARAGARVSVPVSLRDLAATTLDLVGAREPALPGASWSGLLRLMAPAAITPVLSATTRHVYGDSLLHSLITDRYHYIRETGSSEHLFDLAGDPLEQNNLAREGRAFRPLVSMRGFLDEVLSCPDTTACGTFKAAAPAETRQAE